MPNAMNIDGWQQYVFEQLLMPLMLMLGLDAQLEDGYGAALWLLAGTAQLLVLILLLWPLERWWPAEDAASTARAAAPEGATPAEALRLRRRAIGVDAIYTAIHRLGLFRAVLFLSLEPVWSAGLGWARAQGLPTWHLDALWPGVTDLAVVSFLIYLVVFDFLGWLLHFLQHRWSWWWQLHALHHSQRHLTVWSDNRNHLLDDVLHDAIWVVVGLLVGVAPAQFVAVVAVTQLLESLSHANLRWSFGRWGGRLLVSPLFHRRHHAMEAESDWTSDGRLRSGTVVGHNYGVLFPWWDRLFGTIDDRPGIWPTGLRDQLEGWGSRDYGQGFWMQQWRGLQRLAGAVGLARPQGPQP